MLCIHWYRKLTPSRRDKQITRLIFVQITNRAIHYISTSGKYIWHTIWWRSAIYMYNVKMQIFILVLNELWFIWMDHTWTYQRNENQQLFLIEFILRLNRSQSKSPLLLEKTKQHLFHKRMSKLTLFTLELKVIKNPSLLIMT